jgi:hypothetical protein
MSPVLTKLEKRRLELGMPYPALAKQAGVPLPSLTRCFSQRGNPSFATVEVIATVLGMPLTGPEVSVDTLLEKQADSKSRRLVAMTQATSALEAQAVGEEHLERLRKHNFHALLAGSRRKLWSE